jgi:ppGpp synthetase/RelA/SpoT-type nucleotidyltranferase
MTTLVCTLGTSTPVITEILDALRVQKNLPVHRLVIIHTTSKDVFQKKTKSTDKEVGLHAMREYLKSGHYYNKIEVETRSLGRESILTLEDNKHLLETLLNVLSEELKTGNDVYMSIAGGFKTMSAMALFSAYLLGCKGVFHILVQGDEAALTDQYGFEIPVNLLSLVEIPTISLAPFLRTVVAEIDRENRFEGELQKYLAAGRDMQEVFDKTNEQLKRIAYERSLKDEYERRRDRYEQICLVVATIIRALAGKTLVMKPQVDYRVKSFTSFLEKVEREKITDPFAQVRDFAGVRIICYFKEDVAAMVNAIKACSDFTSLDYKTHEGQGYRYQDEKFFVKLSDSRLNLPENSGLQDIWCEIQIKTFFDHAWSQVEHRFRYKSDEYRSLNQNDRETVDKSFLGTNVNIEDALKKLSELRNIYSAFQTSHSAKK